MPESGTGATLEQTEVGSYFVANYPPFSVWKHGGRRPATRGPRSPRRPRPGVPLGLYLHIPFCRKRCHFCYFRVYTDKNAKDVDDYLDALVREWELYQQQPAIAGRPLDFVYFGGGTPSFLSTHAAREPGRPAERRSRRGTGAEEITFECEPGTLTERQAGGDPRHGRHAPEPRRRELRRPHPRDQRPRASLRRDLHGLREGRARSSFPQINIDLIAGMVGETDENWQACVAERSSFSRTASRSTRWSCRSTRRSARTC